MSRGLQVGDRVRLHPGCRFEPPDMARRLRMITGTIIRAETRGHTLAFTVDFEPGVVLGPLTSNDIEHYEER